MASSSEAFEKFSIWENLRTPLKVTVMVSGRVEDIFSTALIFGLDSELGLVAIGISATRSIARFDVEDATFSVEDKRVVATRNDSDWLIFEEE